MSRLLIYRPNEKGFNDWIDDMPYVRTTITSYEREWDPVIKFRMHEEYAATKAYYDRYLEFKNSLNVDLGLQLKYRLRNGSWRYDFNYKMKDELIQEWMKFECPEGMSRLKRITNEEIGLAIKEAREFACIGRKEIAELIGINENTYKCYEEGRRSVPYRIMFLLNQIFNNFRNVDIFDGQNRWISYNKRW